MSGLRTRAACTRRSTQSQEDGGWALPRQEGGGWALRIARSGPVVWQFALFNYVNELNGECEKLEEQISDIRSEIEKYKGQGLNTDNQRKKILKDLEERLQRTEAKAEQYEKKYEAAMKTVSALKVWCYMHHAHAHAPCTMHMPILTI